ncbi:HAD-IC family P-type ATPase [candidate division KSB1 bacterium]|nr:HAD-IC family P-type ATPase [candidate division KSB1 bacterium]
MDIFNYATLSEQELSERFSTSAASGLSSQQASEHLSTRGYNEIKANQVRWYDVALRQFKSAFIYLLIVAAIIVFIVGEHLDAAVIISFVFINALLGFYQEYKSELSLRALQQFITKRTRVKRDSHWDTIDSRNLVPGDIIKLETGDSVPADVRILSTHYLVVNETTLTGESVPVPKNQDVMTAVPKSIYEGHNLCFSGTSVVEGDAIALVLETGARTAIGTIAKLTLETTKESEFSKGIGRFSQFILRMILITLAVVFAMNLILKGERANIIELVIFSIALVVSVIPEALPVVTTVSLSRGALRLAKQDVVVKRLTAIEDIGSIEVLCSDKTGTLTENSLTVTEFSPGADPGLLSFAALTVAQTEQKTEPFDIGILEAFAKNNLSSDKQPERLMEIPFNPQRRRNSVLLRDGNETIMLVRGAPEDVLHLSSLNETEQKALHSWLMEKGKAGERTIAIAKRVLPSDTTTISPEDEHDLDFLGVIAFSDPIKPSTFQAVEKAKQLGVQLKIITGDSPEVAGAVGVKIGLLEDATQVISGFELMSKTPEERTKAIMHYDVFARVTPEQKYEIIQTLQQTYTVGFLGEGINDAPALKLATVSMVVESAADIAREAADIILLQKNLEVIIDGIRSGREGIANSIKYLKATLASNFGNFYAIAIGSLFIDFLPMLPLQILLVNLLSDFPMISIATDNVDIPEVTKPRKYDVKEIVLISIVLGVVSMVFDFMFFAIFVREGANILQTNWYMGSIITELIFLFSVRSKLPFFKAKRPSSYVLVLTGIAIILTVLLPYTGIGQSIFHFTPPTAKHMGTILALVGSFFVCSELVKYFYYHLTD